MIFDSKEMKDIQSLYETTPNYKVPLIVLLDRIDEYGDERELIEKVISEVKPNVQKRWMKGILNVDDGNHIGTWFEIMLYHWLEPLGILNPQPNIQDNKPDFLLKINGKEIIIEATVSCYKYNEQIRRKYQDCVYHSIEQLQLPVGINLEKLDFIPDFNLSDFQTKILSWSNTNPKEEFTFSDSNGNEIIAKSSSGGIGVVGPVEWFNVDSERFFNVLVEKSEQHKEIRKLGYPYIIAILIESGLHSADNVVNAWYGKRQWVYNDNFTEFIDEFFDSFGVSYEDKDIIHKYVSGILIFKAKNQKDFKGRRLKGWYIDNINCDEKYKIDNSIFPVEDCFIELGEDKGKQKIGWKNKSFG